MSSRYTYCESAPSSPFFGQQGRKLAPEDATAVVVVEKFGAVNPARRSLVEKCRRRHRQERRHEVEPPTAPGSTEKIGDGGQSRSMFAPESGDSTVTKNVTSRATHQGVWRAQ